VQPEPAARNPGPMSLAAVECLRALGAAAMARAARERDSK
jgi:hypothetical protein